jgi:Domain of unknown function (DUF4148)
MNRRFLAAAALTAASFSAFASDVDLLPNGYVSSVIREAQSRSIEPAVPRALGEAKAPLSNEPSLKTREQVVAETREAARQGLLNVGEADTVNATPEQLRQIEEAGLRARAVQSAAK